jgi:hypothetical protein
MHQFDDAAVAAAGYQTHTPCLSSDALPPILQMMIGDHFRFIVMLAKKFSHRRATLHGSRMEMKLDPDDLPEGF